MYSAPMTVPVFALLRSHRWPLHRSRSSFLIETRTTNLRPALHWVTPYHVHLLLVQLLHPVCILARAQTLRSAQCRGPVSHFEPPTSFRKRAHFSCTTSLRLTTHPFCTQFPQGQSTSWQHYPFTPLHLASAPLNVRNGHVYRRWAVEREALWRKRSLKDDEEKAIAGVEIGSGHGVLAADKW
eukprot:TRINITY_DN14142_c0_g1_i1.p1 TRINITY_DN14142_c0_g1~~TRINITY_DN14142_c0_g1_i1.p1  ORF type:complete len:183 (+),score=4.32 TRINITY_DN14142_c0_g1_i1:93-641(+)